MRHARHVRKSETRAQLIARNMKRRAPEPTPEPETHAAIVADPPEARTEPKAEDQGKHVGYRVESTDNDWHKLIGPDGEQVGAAKRSHDEAFALIPGDDG